MNLNTDISNACYYAHPEVREGSVFLEGTGSRFAHVSARIDCTGDITLGAWVMFGRNTTIYTHDHDFHLSEGQYTPLLKIQENIPSTVIVYKPKIIKEDVWINHGAIVLMNCTLIAKGVIIGAGAIVTKPITCENSIWAGNPARFIGMRFRHPNIE